MVLEGLRATGKTTLAKQIVAPDRFFSLAEPPALARAQSDPQGWLEGLPFGSAVDEAQLAPGLTLAAKALVDTRHVTPGQFLFTGSSRISRSELGGSDALAGRAVRLRVEPFAQCEIEGKPRDVMGALFDEDPRSWHVAPMLHVDVTSRFVPGGLPTIRAADEHIRSMLIDQLAESLFNGDIYRTGKSPDGILRLFRHLCATSSHLEVFDKIGKTVELSKVTIQGYIDALTDVFLVQAVEGFRPDPAKRITEKRRLFVADPAFVADALRASTDADLFDSKRGGFVETIVATEVRRLIGWTRSRALNVMHWRKSDKEEVDLVIERHDGKVLALEVKAARSLAGGAGRGLAAFRNQYPQLFHRGYVIHSGDHIQQLADDIWSIPLSALWMIGDEIRPTRSSDLADRLTAARQRIAVQRGETRHEVAQREWLSASRIENANRQFDEAGQLFDLVIPTLHDLELHTELRDSLRGSSPPDVIWSATRVLLISRSVTGPMYLKLQAKVLDRDLDQIGWILSCGDDEFGGAFTTMWHEDPLPAVDERFGRFADKLPDIIETLRSS